jgi:hypothetical protein
MGYLRVSRARLVRIALLTAGIFAAGCAGDAPVETAIGPVAVRIGAIDPDAFDAVREEPASIAERVEQLVDLFWKAGCRGESLSQQRAKDARYPDLVCRLPGRSPRSVVVAAYLAAKAGSGRDWTGSTLLPLLYDSLHVEQREHSFVFVGFGHRSERGLQRDLRRLQEAQSNRVANVVDLERVRAGGSAILFASRDPSLRTSLEAVRVSLGESAEPLRLVALPPWRAPSSRGRIPTTTVASIESGGRDETAEDRPRADDRETYRATARTVAVFLGYLDAALLPPRARSADRR